MYIFLWYNNYQSRGDIYVGMTIISGDEELTLRVYIFYYYHSILDVKKAL